MKYTSPVVEARLPKIVREYIRIPSRTFTLNQFSTSLGRQLTRRREHLSICGSHASTAPFETCEWVIDVTQPCAYPARSLDTADPFCCLFPGAVGSNH